MNAERLHRILIDLNKDLKKEKIVTLIQQVRDHLQNQVNQPNQSSHQTNLVKSLESLYKALGSSSYNRYPPSRKEIIGEIGGNISLGISLKNQIQTILSSNVITPVKALEDIKQIYENLQNFQTAINNTLSGFQIFGIGEEDIEQGQCELGYTIPRNFVGNKLSELKKEIGELNFILNHISEVVTGEREEYEVKTISSSDFLFYIMIGLKIADVLSKVLERIFHHYDRISKIKNLKNQLSEIDVPAEKTESLEVYSNVLMETEIKTIAEEILEEHYGGDVNRKNELRNSLIIALNKLANRIDYGFDVKIRVKPLPKPSEDEEITEKYREQSELINSIQSSAQNIIFLETSGESILKLPEGKDEDEKDGES